MGAISVRNGTFENLVYEKEIDQIFIWMEEWDVEQINRCIVKCVKSSSFSIKKVLRTILEPLLHRDYMYHKFDTGPHATFSPISSFITRELHVKMEREANKNTKRRPRKAYRLKSAHLTTEDDATTWSQESVLPNLKLKSQYSIKTDSSLKSNSYSTQKMLSMCNHVSYEKKEADSFEVNEKLDIDNYLARSNDFLNSNPSETFHDESKVIEQKHKMMTKTIIKKQSIFQSPSRATTLQRSKTQLLPPIRGSSPLKVSNIEKPFISDDVLQKFPLSMKAIKRHMQHVRCCSETTVVPEKSSLNGMRICQSTPNISSLFNQQKSLKMRYKEQITKVCLLLISWNEWQEEYFFRTFLKMLSLSQLYFIYAFLMVQLYCDIIALLPQNLSMKIFTYLKPRQVITCSKVSRKWSSLCSHNDLWKDICEKKNITLSSQSYFDSYFKHRKIKQNWQDGRYTISEFIKQTTSITCVDIYEDLLATGSSDKTIRIWKGNRTKCFMTLEGHQKSIWAIQFVSQLLLVSCSNDHTIKIWNLRTGSCTRTIIGHDGPVWCLHLQGEHFATGSSDKSAKVWSLRSCNLVRSFSNHPGGVYSIALSNNSRQLFTGTVDKTIRIWNMDTHDYVASFQVGTISTPVVPVSGLCFDNGYLWCACHNDFQVWDMVSMKVVITNTDAHKKIECGQLKIWNDGQSDQKRRYPDNDLKGRIVTCGKDGKVKVWSLCCTKAMTTILLGDDSFSFLQFDESKITLASHDSSQDSTVKIINFASKV